MTKRYAGLNQWYAVQSPVQVAGDQYIYSASVAYNKSDAIKQFLKFWVNQRWKYHYSKGFRVVRVEIKVIPAWS
jgi:hypothetical protein